MDKLIFPKGCEIIGEVQGLTHAGDIEMHISMAVRQICSTGGSITIRTEGAETPEKVEASGCVDISSAQLQGGRISGDSIIITTDQLDLSGDLSATGDITLVVQGEARISEVNSGDSIAVKAGGLHANAINAGSLNLTIGSSAVIKEISARSVVLTGNINCEKLVATEGVEVNGGNVKIHRLESPRFIAGPEVTGIVMVSTAEEVKAEGVRGFLHPSELDMFSSGTAPAIPATPQATSEGEPYMTQDLTDLPPDPTPAGQPLMEPASETSPTETAPATDLVEEVSAMPDPVTTPEPDLAPPTEEPPPAVDLADVEELPSEDLEEAFFDEAPPAADIAEPDAVAPSPATEDVPEGADEDLPAMSIDEIDALPPITEDQPHEEPAPFSTMDTEELPPVSMDDIEALPPATSDQVADESVEDLDEVDALPDSAFDDVEELPVEDLDDIEELPLDDLTEVEELPTEALDDVEELPVEDLDEIEALPAEDLDEVEELPAADFDALAEPADMAEESPADAFGEPESETAPELPTADFDDVEDLSVDDMDDLPTETFDDPDHSESLEPVEDSEPAESLIGTEFTAEDIEPEGDLETMAEGFESFDMSTEEPEMGTPAVSMNAIQVNTDDFTNMEGLDDPVTQVQDLDAFADTDEPETMDEAEFMDPDEVSELPEDDILDTDEPEEASHHELNDPLADSLDPEEVLAADELEEDPEAMLMRDLNGVLDQIRAFFPEDNYPQSIDQIRNYVANRQLNLFRRARNRDSVIKNFQKFNHEQIDAHIEHFFVILDAYFKAEG